MSITTYKIAASGNSTTNFACFVLCRKRYIPIQEPIPPPKNATNIKVRSGIRHALLMALCLSIPIMVKPIILRIRIYPDTKVVTVCPKIYFSSIAIAIASSFSCLSSTKFGASVIKQEASFTLGNAITSRMLSS